MANMKRNAAGIVAQRMTERELISNLREHGPFDIVTSYVGCGWDDVQFAAQAAGMKVYREWSDELQAMHLFSEYYHFENATTH